jgi:DNA (cytosine-5)-methyltransferase 1
MAGLAAAEQCGASMTRPRLLDLFSGAGGAAMGYHRAGFDVTGVDIKPQPRYPFEFIEGDAFEEWFDFSQITAIHASPPCQDHIRGGLQSEHETGWMLKETRAMLNEAGKPWVIENVPGAPMRPDYILCGSQFDLSVRRHRWFETSWHGYSLMAPCDHRGAVVGVYGHPHGAQGAWPGMIPGTPESWCHGMGIDWMTMAELAQAIPPAYTEYIGALLLGHLAGVAA